MKDPITKKQHKEFHKFMINQFEQTYAKALKSGAVSESDKLQGFMLAKCCAIISTESMSPLHHENGNFLRNLRKFV